MTELLTATDLEQWSERNDSRQHLPTLVRRLILAVAAPETLRMPAAEAVGLPGLDGEVTSPSGAPPFLPSGRSVWELGTGRGPQDKAQRDYRKRVDGSTRDERAGVVFVFVTSRRWPGSQGWVDRRAENDDGWAGIRVLDAEDLAAWLALCPGVHRWLASEQLGRDPHGVIGLRDWYRNWAERTQPAIPAVLLLAGRDVQVRRLRDRLRAEPGEQVVASASRDESVAFVAASLMAEPPQDATTMPRQTSEDPPVKTPGGSEEPVGAVADAEQGEPVGSSTAEENDPATGLARATDAPAELEALLERALVVEDVRAWRRVAAHESPTVLVPVFAEPEIGDALRAGHHVVLPRAGRPADAFNPFVGKIDGVSIGTWRLQLQCSMRSSPVVVAGVLVERSPEMLFAGDEHAVGDLAADGADEPFGIGVGSRALRWDLADGDAGVGQDGVEGGGELPCPVTDQESELVGLLAEVHE